MPGGQDIEADTGHVRCAAHAPGHCAAEKQDGSRDRGGRGFYADYWEAEGDRLKEAFYEGIGPEEVGAGIREPEQEQELDLIFGSHGEGAMLAWIHPEKGYLVTDQGKVYQMTDAFMDLYRECLEEWL